MRCRDDPDTGSKYMAKKISRDFRIFTDTPLICLRTYRGANTENDPHGGLKMEARRAEREEMKMNTNQKNEMQELNLEELEQVNGGWWPIVIVAAAAGYCFYKAYEEGKKANWK